MIELVVDPGQVSASDHEDFPVFISLKNHLLKSVQNGGTVFEGRNNNFFFTLPNGETKLSWQMKSFDPVSGELTGWVRVPVLFHNKATRFDLHWNEPFPEFESVFNDRASEMHWFHSNAAVFRSSVPEDFPRTGQITVEAWIFTNTACSDALQPVVSQWSPATAFGSFEAYDAGRTDGLESKGFFGAIFDGRYIYFVPQHDQDREAHGIVLRYDTQKNFKNPSSYAAYDAGHTSDLNTKGYYGAGFDGRYIYFVPRQDSIRYHSRVLRYDTNADFKSSQSWIAYDAGIEQSQQGLIFDGRYFYFCPGFSGNPRTEDTRSGCVIRYDTRTEFQNSSAWSTFDAGAVFGASVRCFDGGAFDGRYVYFAPLVNRVVLQYDTWGTYEDPGNWHTFHAGQVGLKACVGIVYDGHFLYFVPYANSNMVRFNTHREFCDPASWSCYIAENIGGLNTGGFDGGFFDGRYVYFVPFVSCTGDQHTQDNQRYIFHANFLRYDTTGGFNEPESWSAVNASQTDGLKTIGYNAGAFDGRYLYMAPWQDGSQPDPVHGRVLRYDTLANNGSFSLRVNDYGHNGGLCAALPGPSFVLNTESGAISAAAHHALQPGWHHLAGIYNGERIQLFVDGELARERAGNGKPLYSKVPITIGQFDSGVARFPGRVEAARIYAQAKSAGWIQTAYRNLKDPKGFVRVEEKSV